VNGDWQRRSTHKLFLIFAGEKMTFSKLLLSSAIALLPMHSVAHAQDAKRGEKLYEECVACHATERGVNGVGPDLHGVFGRKAAELADFRYSPALKRSGITWTAQNLDSYIADPQKAVPANRMPYSGMPEARDRADLIAYIQTVLK
jgi:cytochrome c